MRILYLSPRQCWPAVSGAKLRDYHLARSLGENTELTYLYFKGDTAIASRDMAFCRKLIAVDKPKPYTPGKIARGLFHRLPLTLLNYYSPEMAAAVTETVEAQPFDLVHVDSIHMVTYLPVLPEALRKKVVFNWHNIESELLFRYAATTSSLPRKAYASLTARRVKSAELDILRKSFGHLVCSERERKALLEWTPDARIAVVENGVDTKSFDGLPKATRNRVLFVGAMAYHANSDAILTFTDRVWPAIHERFPQWTLTLVGSDPPPQVRALAERPGVEVTGTVPDVRPYYSEAALAIVPLLTGGGTRLKILEALAAGVPVVSTSLGVEGLSVHDGKEVLIADKESDWLPAASSLADQGALWQRLAVDGRRLVESRYDWDVLGKAMVEIYREWLGVTSGPLRESLRGRTG
jgi:glycosyltransferase involved in cell wall biosynthesis